MLSAKILCQGKKTFLASVGETKCVPVARDSCVEVFFDPQGDEIIISFEFNGIGHYPFGPMALKGQSRIC